MTESNPPAPPAPASPGPAVTLKALAAAIEAGDPPEMEDVKAALAGFRAAKLEKRAQQHVIEAREDAKQGRMPDALLLRLIAKAVETADPALVVPAPVDPAVVEERKAASAANARAASAAKRVEKAERTVRPDGVGVTKLKMVDIPIAESRTDEKTMLEIIDRRGPALISPPAEPAELEDEEDDSHGLHYGDYDVDAQELLEREHEEAAAALDDAEDADALASEIFEEAARRGREMNVTTGIDVLRQQADAAKAALTVKERQVLEMQFPTSFPTEKKNGNGGAVRREHFELVDEFSLGDVEAQVDELLDAETPAELVGRAADLIEHGEMPKHADLVGDLYDLAAKLENVDLDNARGTLLERLERDIERRIERAIKSPADLPEWMVRWADRERMRENEKGREWPVPASLPPNACTSCGRTGVVTDGMVVKHTIPNTLDLCPRSVA